LGIRNPRQKEKKKKRKKERKKERKNTLILPVLVLMVFLVQPKWERWGAGVETQKNVRGEIGDGVEYHSMKPTPRR